MVSQRRMIAGSLTGSTGGKVAKANQKRRCWRITVGVCFLAASGIGTSSAEQLAAQTGQHRLKQTSSAQKPLARSNVAAANAASNVPLSAADAKPTRKPQSDAIAIGPYYVDFRARTAASYGHAFVWFGKTSEEQVEVAGLHP